MLLMLFMYLQMVFTGLLVGAPIGGLVADKFGRRVVRFADIFKCLFLKSRRLVKPSYGLAHFTSISALLIKLH